MTLRKTLVASAVAARARHDGSAVAQQQTGEIYGRAADNSGAVLPGVTVTVAGPALIQPRVAVTSETGTYRVPELPIGTYSVTFELAGFRTMNLQDIRVTIGFRAQVNGNMELSTVQETVTVTGASPLVDTRETGTSSTFDLETMQNIPSARDPWVMLERTPGIFMDRANVGGNQSGQQSGYISRGATTTNNKWSIDGVDITDMAATGASPIYYDFDMLEEMQVTTGGADVVAADRRRRHQPRDQERHRSLQGQRPLPRHRRSRCRATTSPLSSRRRAPAPARRSRTSRTTASTSAARSPRARCGTGAATARRTSRPASSASTRRPRSAVQRRAAQFAHGGHRRCSAAVSRPTSRR